MTALSLKFLTFDELCALNQEYRANIAGRNLDTRAYYANLSLSTTSRYLISLVETHCGFSIKGKWVCEFGCGAGFVTNEAKLVGAAESYGVDIAESPQWGKLGGSYMKCDCSSTPLPDSRFDLVYSIASIEHFDNVNGVLREAHRVLKPGGTFVIKSGGFFLCNIGGHLYDRGINVPFPQLLFKKADMERLLGTKIFFGLNFITVDALWWMVEASGFFVSNWIEDNVMSKDLESYNRFHSILEQYRQRDLFTESVVCTLRKS